MLYKTDTPHGDGAVLSTFDEHFTSVCSLSPSGLGCGVANTVASIKRGYSTSFMLTSGSGGVTSLVMEWGSTLQQAYSTQHPANTDIVTTKLGYWTDNQAYYDWYHWFPNVNREGTPQDGESRPPIVHSMCSSGHWIRARLRGEGEGEGKSDGGRGRPSGCCEWPMRKVHVFDLAHAPGG